MRNIADRLTYPDDSPLADIQLARLHPELPVLVKALTPIHIGHLASEAWLDSEWMSEATDLTIKERLKQPFAVASRQAAEKVLEGEKHQTAWIAVPREKNLDTHMDHIRSNPILGYAFSKDDVSGNRFMRGVKRFIWPEKVYATVSDVAVNQFYRGNNIGTALFDASLSGFHDTQKATTYVLGDNQRLVDSLEQLGYEITGERSRDDLVAGLSLTEQRLQADSVYEVRSRLAESFPWLREVTEYS